MADVTVITPAIPERLTTFLPETIQSVAAQTFRPRTHLVGIDVEHRGNAYIQNKLLATVDTEWFVLLADDDLLHPTFLERCMAHTEDADVVYCHADMSQWPEDSPQRRTINAPFDKVRIFRENWIPGGCALVRTEMFRQVGQFSELPRHLHYHDWLLWQDITRLGGRFVYLPEELWTYRCHAEQLQSHIDGRRRVTGTERWV